MENFPEQNIQLLKDTAQDVLVRLGYEANVDVISNDKDPELKIVSISSADNLSTLIGKNGQNIKALEHVIRLLYFSAKGGHSSRGLSPEGSASGGKKVTAPVESVSFMVDLNDYRKLRARQVVDGAVEAANRVRTSKKAEALLPMSSFERRLIHVELASCPDIETESIGEEPKRRVVIRPLII